MVTKEEIGWALNLVETAGLRQDGLSAGLEDGLECPEGWDRMAHPVNGLPMIGRDYKGWQCRVWFLGGGIMDWWIARDGTHLPGRTMLAGDPAAESLAAVERMESRFNGGVSMAQAHFEESMVQHALSLIEGSSGVNAGMVVESLRAVSDEIELQAAGL